MPNENKREYKTLVTAIGKSKIAAFIQGSDKVNITQMAVGDGAGAFYIPTADMTALVNEVWRGNIAGKKINEHSANMIDVKVIIPADIGGFTVREAALFDEDNNMIAICNIPDTEKAIITTGAAGTLTLVMHIVLTDVDAVEFTIDPNLDVVTSTDLNVALEKHNTDSNAHHELFQAKNIGYDNSRTEFDADNVQDALDDLLDETLPHLIEDTNAVKESVEKRISISEKAAANGVASLDETGKVPLEQIPEGVGILPRLDVIVGSYGCEVTVTDGITVLNKVGSDVISFYLPRFGVWTVTSGNKSETINIDAVKVYQLKLLTLQSASWNQIAVISESGKASELWEIGDEKTITINNEICTVAITGFDHDDKSDGSGKAGVTFGLKNCLDNGRIMDKRSTISVFTNTDLYNWLQTNLLQSLPSELQNVLKAVYKKTSAGFPHTQINVTSMKIFLFSEIEVLGELKYSLSGEGTLYPYFATNTTRRKKTNSGWGCSWWLRSPRVVQNATVEGNTFTKISDTGYPSTLGSTYSSLISFGFCV